MEIKERTQLITNLLEKNKLEAAIEQLQKEIDLIYNKDMMVYISTLKQSYKLTEKQSKLNEITKAEFDTKSKKIGEDIRRLLAQLILFYDNQKINYAGEATLKLKLILQGIRSNQLLLNESNLFLDDIRKIFDEIRKSFQVVLDVITKFNAPLFQDPLILDTYLEFERGVVYDILQDGIGHCHLIMDYYNNGLKSHLQNKIGTYSQEEYDKLDTVMSELGNGDYTIFHQLVEVGNFIQQQSAKVLEARITDGDNGAKGAIIQGRRKLKELENELRSAYDDVQEVALKFAYTP